jgi:hypothetical protein
MLEREESVPCMVKIYNNKRAVIMNGARNAPTELEMEGFVMIIILKVSSNQNKWKHLDRFPPVVVVVVKVVEVVVIVVVVVVVVLTA